jgi:hypothetical protein
MKTIDSWITHCQWSVGYRWNRRGNKKVSGS